MSRPRRLRWGCFTVLVGLALGVAGVGTGVWWMGQRPWNVSLAAPLVEGLIRRWTGWSVEIQRCAVTPWRDLRLDDVVVEPRGGGRLHVRTIGIRYDIRDLVRRRWMSRWELREIRMDPGSWKIRKDRAVALLAAGPIADRMTFRVVRVGPRVAVKQVRALGWLIRLHGDGEWRADGTMSCWVRGQLASSVLAAMGFKHARGTWESFAFQARGLVRQPSIRFEAGSLKLAIGQGEPS